MVVITREIGEITTTRVISMRQHDGVITAFDFDAGHGRVRVDEDGRELFFHCTAIADGSRMIPVGARVSFLIVPGHNGLWEATNVVVRMR
jgi:cold shock CspA family protein